MPLTTIPPKSKIDTVLWEVSLRHRLSLKLILSADRRPRIVFARWEAAARLRKLGMSYVQIGRVLGRDHKTIMHAIRSYYARRTRTNASRL